jgi:hypothetical protein
MSGEFGGRWPSIREVMRIPDAHWRKLPGFGPAKVQKLRSVIENLVRQADDLVRLPDPALLAEYRRTVEELRRLGSLQSKLRIIEVELGLRQLLPERVYTGLDQLSGTGNRSDEAVRTLNALLQVDPVQDEIVLDRGTQLVRHSVL